MTVIKMRVFINPLSANNHFNDSGYLGVIFSSRVVSLVKAMIKDIYFFPALLLMFR